MSAVRTLFSKNRGRKAGESLVERYRAFGRVITRAAIVGTAMMQVNTKAELPTASSTNDCANSPTANSSSAVPSDAIAILAVLMMEIALLFRRALTPTSAGTVK